MKAIDRLYKYINYKGIKATPFESKIGLSNGYLGKQFKRNADLGEGILLRIIENCQDINPVWLLMGSGSMLKEDFLENTVITEQKRTHSFALNTEKVKSEQAVPLYDIKESGASVLFQEDNNEQPIDYITIPNLPKCDGALFVSGNSMNPIIKAGDIILYKKVSTVIDSIFWGEMYLITLTIDGEDEFVMVKWIQKSELGSEYVKLVSENNHYQAKDFPFKHIKGLALIKASISVASMV